MLWLSRMLSSVQSFRFYLGNNLTIRVVSFGNKWDHGVIGLIVYGCPAPYLGDDSRVRFICCGNESMGPTHSHLLSFCSFLPGALKKFLI